jgi:hypothetical protein
VLRGWFWPISRRGNGHPDPVPRREQHLHGYHIDIATLPAKQLGGTIEYAVDQKPASDCGKCRKIAHLLLRQSQAALSHRRTDTTPIYSRRAAGAGILLPLMFPVLSWRITGVLVSVWFATGRGAWVVITGAESTSDLDRARRTEEFPFPS